MFFRTTKNTQQKGFSLIELLVAVGLFTVVMTASAGTLLALIDANQKAQSIKSAVNNLNFALDSMTRTIRTGYDYYCDDEDENQGLGPVDPPFTNDCDDGGIRIILTNDQSDRVGYRVKDERIERKFQNETWIPLTAEEVEIEDMLFYVSNTDPADNLQPIVTIAIKGNAGAIEDTDTTFSVQTTVTQRLLDF